MTEVQILLSTYNGETYLEEQIESVLHQSFSNWQLVIRDDGSTDKTQEIIDKYKKKYPEKVIQLYKGQGGNASQSFISMLKYTETPYLMFCDQDDVWLPTKVEESLNVLKELEKKNSIALVFTDMEVVSANLKSLHASFMKNQKLNPEWLNNKNAVFAQSMAAGCTMIFTKALVDILHPIKAPLFQHDHWLLMHAANYGELAFLNKPLLKYRQHSANAVGSHQVNLTYFSKKLSAFGEVQERWQYIESQFEPKPDIKKIRKAKFKINRQRLLTF